MPQITGKIKKAEPIPEGVTPKPSWEGSFNRNFGFAVSPFKKYSMSVFLDTRLKDGNSKNPPAFLQKTEQVVARCISCVGEEWELRSEPLDSGELGLVMYTRAGKALATGTGKLTESGVQCKIATLYKGITNALKVTYGVTSSVNTRTGDVTVSATVTVTDPR